MVTADRYVIVKTDRESETVYDARPTDDLGDAQFLAANLQSTADRWGEKATYQVFRLVPVDVPAPINEPTTEGTSR